MVQLKSIDSKQNIPFIFQQNFPASLQDELDFEDTISSSEDSNLWLGTLADFLT